ncbi:ClpV1 family T6SS ATPase [Brucella endophytica]|uniref:ClpV1 family T6SS ATPase n=1 Tax=Brucella endophytica TaxID=1963359 RepID=A0A916SA48_9HYPH|nr:type VI secretion system ATPase TssH [Brucella endophytica]GGA88165.1 ClpV1 family T6SS ATPase [Brucella endophytica]
MSQIDVHRLVSALAADLHAGLEAAASLAARSAHATVEVAHWLRALLDNPDVREKIVELSVDSLALQRQLDETIGDMARQDGVSLTLSQNLLALAREAWLIASLQFGRQRIGLADLLLAMNSDSALRMLVRGIAPSLRTLDSSKLQSWAEEARADVATSGEANAAPASAGGGNEFLKLYTHDLTADARAGKIDPVIGRGGELRQVLDVLMRRRQNNPILVGEAGVGKTAVAEALALAIAQGDVPEVLRGVRLLMLDLSLLQAGAGVKGEFERRLHGVVDAVKSSPEPIILFIDEAHGLIGAGGQAGQGDAANILKPALARGELRTIAATTWSEYKRYFEKDAALTRRFQPVKVNEPDEDTAIRMLRGIADVFRKHHGVRIRESALEAAVRLSARYIPSRQLPDKAISLLDTAAASVALARQTVPEALAALRNELHLTEVEIRWLRDEPPSEAGDARIADLVLRRDELQAEIAELQNRHGRELELVEKADRLEDALVALAAEPDGLKPVQEEAEAGNVTPFPPRAHAGRHGPAAELNAVEAELGSLGGETALVPRVVDRDVIAGIVARWTGIPVGKLLSDQIDAVNTLEERLKKRVIGQDAAIARVAAAMRVSRAGLSDPRRPPAVFLFAGMSGTGKTETALSLADILYGSSQYLTTINMSEFKEEHKVSMLLGSPPGYVGYGEGGVLTEAVRRRPYGVLLLDEIDKAHPGVQEIFYQVFDKGTLRDGEGRDVDFKNTTIIMTANTGSELLANLAADPDTMPEGEALEALLLPELQKQFKPAFLGRTTILPFMPLGAEALAGIVELQIARIRERVRASYGTALSLSDEARGALVARAKSSDMGARVIEAMIARDLMPVLSAFFLDALVDGRSVQRVKIDFDGRSFQVEEIAVINESAAGQAGDQALDGTNTVPSAGNSGKAVTP